MIDTKAIKDLVVCSFYGTTPDPTKYSVDDVRNSLKEEIHNIACDYNTYRRNKLDLFEIMQEAYDEILPKTVEDFMGTFAEIKTVPLGQKAQFKVWTGRRRAKQFITAVALSGAYESFRLDSNTFEVGGKAIGGAAYIDFERYLSGDEDIAESTSLLLEGLTEALYGEIQRAMIAAVNADDRPAANKAITAGFDADAMAKLCNVASTYGNGGVTIFAAPEFVAEMGPEAVGLPIHWSKGTEVNGVATPVYNPRNIEEIAQFGRIKTFKGNPIVEIPQSYTDETNEVTITNPALAYIFPNGRTKPVKIVFEGGTQIDDFKHRDRSMEIEVYQRVGVAILTNYDWCIYVNTDLQDPEDYPTKYETNFVASNG
jgi:hypothetical protein